MIRMIVLEFPDTGKKCVHCRFWRGEVLEGWHRKETGVFTARRRCTNPFRYGEARYGHHPACVLSGSPFSD